MPTGEETELALAEIGGDFPDEIALIRKRLADIADERPMTSWLREVVEALTASTNATSQMRETLVDGVVPDIAKLKIYLDSIRKNEAERTRVVATEAEQKRELALRGADTWSTFVKGGVTMGTTVVKHPGFWALISSIATWLSVTYGFSLLEMIP